jgi:peptidoglycan/LPS O-acetylase OafA/YrhL
MDFAMLKPSKVLPLTSLRFFAAMYVVGYHTVDRVFTHCKDLSTVHGRLFDLGYIAVSFFFTLSGYILAVSYLPRRVSKRQFWWARFARIYPLFLLTLLVDAPQYLVGVAKQIGYPSAVPVLIEKVIGNMLLLQAWAPAMRSMDWPNWSLSVEAFFYLLFPFLLTRIARLKTPVLAAAGALSYAGGMGVVTAALHSHASLDVLKFNPLFHLHAFICGTLLGAIRIRSRLVPLYAPAFLCVAIACFTLVVHFYRYLPLPLIHDGLLVPAFVCLILAFDSGNRTMDALLSMKGLVVLGEASYGLYLIHIPLWHVFYHLRIDQSKVAYPLYLACAVALSVLSFFYVETPLRRLLADRGGVFAPRLSRAPRITEPGDLSTEQPPLTLSRIGAATNLDDPAISTAT